MLSSSLFTSSSCHILNASLTHFFALCAVIILCTLFAFIHFFSSFMHYFALLIFSTCILPLVLSIFCSLLILFCFPVYLPITILFHLISCASWSTIYSFAHLSTYHFLSPFLPCSVSGFSFHQFLILFSFSVFSFATLLSYTSPPLSFIHCYYLLPLLLTTFFPFIFLHPHFFSLPFYIYGTTYIWPFL